MQRTGRPAYLGKLTKTLGGMLSLGIVGRTAKVRCEGFPSGALQYKTVSLTILAEPPHLGTEAS
jgi:hypothetical protein